MPDNYKLGSKEAIAAAEADHRAENVQLAAEALEQAGRGIHKVFGQLMAGVPRGNEVHMLIIAQGYVNEAAFALSTLAIEAAPMEAEGPKLVTG